MASWEPVDIDPTDHDEIGEEDDKWGDDLMKDLERRFNEQRQFSEKLETSSNEDFGDITFFEKNKLRKGMIELVVNQICDKITKVFNERRKRSGIQGGASIVEPIGDYDSFVPEDNGNLEFKYKGEKIYIGNINEGLNSLSKMIKKIGVNRLKSIGFMNITDEDIHPYRDRYKDARDKVIKLNENLNERSKTIKS